MEWVTLIAGVLASVAAIFGGVQWLIGKYGKTPEDKQEDIQNDVRKEIDAVKKTGRPQ